MAETWEELVQEAEGLRAAGRFGEAEAAYKRALGAYPDEPMVLHGYGMLAVQTGRLGLAREYLERAATAAPERVELALNASTVLLNMGEIAAAEGWLRRILAVSPTYALAHFNLARVHHHRFEMEAALAGYQQAVELEPELAAGHTSVGKVLLILGRYAEAREASETAVRLAPNDLNVRWFHAGLLLTLGDWEAGWELYEMRHALPGQGLPRHHRMPAWEGQPVAGQTILLHAEQGAGDTLQFLRYAWLLQQQGAKIVLECQAELKDLLVRCPYLAAVRAAGETLPAFAWQRSLPGMPRVCKTRVESIPAPGPYVWADKRKVQTWAEKMKAAGTSGAGRGSRRVGLVWAGNPRHTEDRLRSMPLEALAPLAGVANVTWYSLQKGEAAGQLAGFAGMPIVDLGPGIRTFDDTAAIMENLDLVICVDTAVAHLAGALGRSTWVLLAAQNDWRWLTERTDSPWYGSVRLFRQKRLGSWVEPVAEVAETLAAIGLEA